LVANSWRRAPSVTSIFRYGTTLDEMVSVAPERLHDVHGQLRIRVGVLRGGGRSVAGRGQLSIEVLVRLNQLPAGVGTGPIADVGESQRISSVTAESISPRKSSQL
jgi:hypothetical protein